MSRSSLAARIRAEQDARTFESALDQSRARLASILGEDPDSEPPSHAERSENHTLRIDTCGERFMWRCSCATWGVCDTPDACRRAFAVHADWASRVEAWRAK